MTDIIASSPSLPAMTAGDVAKGSRIESGLRTFEQVEVEITHQLHAGMYIRTARIPARSVATGALIKIPTMLVISGDVTVFVGNDQWIDFRGYHVLPGMAGRKQVFAAHAETFLTMFFPTSAKTVEEAEAEFTDETDLLQSSQQPTNQTITQGEQPCPE